MKRLLTIIFLMLSMVACAKLQHHEKKVQEQALQQGLVAVAKPHFDTTFISPSLNFSHYQKIIVNDLDLSQVEIIQPGAKSAFTHPWTLDDEDRRNYQTYFSEAVKENIFDSGVLQPARSGDSNTLVLKTKITEIAPRASKDDFESRPTIMDVYSEGFGRMTIVFELYDSATNQLLMIATDEQDLGNTWEINNRVQNNFHIRVAFDFWLRKLNRELAAAKTR